MTFKMTFYKNIKFYAILGICLLFVGCLFKFEYATDTYVVASDMKYYYEWALATGRPINSLMFYIFYCMNSPIEGVYYYSYILALICLVAAVYQTYLILKDKTNNEWMAVFLACVIIMNPFVVEYFLFIEKGHFLLGILLTVLSIKCFIRAINGDKRMFLFSLGLEMIIGFLYQPCLGLFGVMSIFFIALNYKDLKQFIVLTAVAAGTYIVGALPEFIFMKLYPNAVRTGTFINFSNIGSALTIAGPVLSVVIYLVIAGLICLLSFIKYRMKDNKKPYWFYLLIYLYLFCGSIIVVIFPLGFTSETVPSYRVIYPLGVLAALVGSEFAFKKDKSKQPKTVKRARFVPVISCLLVEFVFLQTIFISRFVCNYKDEQEILLIQREIDKYENNYEKINYISFYRDNDSHFSHNGTVSLGINIKAFMRDWSDLNSMNYLLKKNYQRVDNDTQIYEQYFKDYKSDKFDPNKQLVFVDDTLHIYVY